MDSTSYTSGRLTAYFTNDTQAQKARSELLASGVPSSAVVLQTLQSNDQDFLDALNRFFGSESDPYKAGSILTLNDPDHATEALAIVQHHGGQIQVRHKESGEFADSTDSATGTQASGNA